MCFSLSGGQTYHAQWGHHGNKLLRKSLHNETNFNKCEFTENHEEAGKENEQTVANLSPAEEATSNDEVEIEKFFQKHLMQD